MTSETFCPACGAARVPDAQFCGACGKPFGESPGLQSNVASAQLQLEAMRMKLIPIRLLGIAAGLALWWFVAGPAFGGDPILTLGSLVVLAFGGLWIGNIIGLAMISGRR